MFRKMMLFLLFSSLISLSLTGCGGNIAKFGESTSTGAQLVSISVTPPNPTIAVNTDQQCLAIGTFSDNTTKDVTSGVTWTSSDADAVDVVSGTEAAGFTELPALDIERSSSLSSPGHIKAKRPGQVRITATWGDISGFTDVTVTSATLVSIAVTPADPSIVEGLTLQFTATGTFSDNSTQNLTATVTWNRPSVDSDIASIYNEPSRKGLAAAWNEGSTTITATSGSVSGTTTLMVTRGGPVTLTWDAPTTNTDGSPLNPATDLATYRIHYGTASQTYTQVVTIQNPGNMIITHTFGLPEGTYYIAVTTVDATGTESDYSNEVMKTI